MPSAKLAFVLVVILVLENQWTIEEYGQPRSDKNMRKTLLLIACLLGCVSALGQGYLAFANIGTGVNSPFKDANGVGLTGTGNYDVEMLAGSTPGTVTDSLGPLFSGPFTSGYFNGGSRTVPAADLDGAGQTYVIIRVWDNFGGTVTSYAQATATFYGLWGATVIGRYLTQSSALVPPAPLAGMPYINGTQLLCCQIPEPTTFALAALGGQFLVCYTLFLAPNRSGGRGRLRATPLAIRLPEP